MISSVIIEMKFELSEHFCVTALGLLFLKYKIEVLMKTFYDCCDLKLSSYPFFSLFTRRHVYL